MAFADAAAAAARTAADAAAEAAAEAAGADDEWGADSRYGGRRGGWRGWPGGAGGRGDRGSWAAAAEEAQPETWENDRFFAPPSPYDFSSSSGNGERRWRGGAAAASGPWRRGGRYGSGSYSRTIVRVSNMDYSILEEDLRELFGAVGDVIKVWIDYDRTDRSKGTGGCIFRFLADAERAIRVYEGKKIEGLPLHLELQVPGGGGSGASAGGDFMSYRPNYSRNPYERGGGYGGGRRGWRG